MVNPWSVAVCIAILLAALAGMALAWRARTRAQRGIVLPAAPADPGQVLARVEGLYLATTPVGRPLERVHAGGLGFRARAAVSVTASGVLLERTGSAPLFLDRDRLAGIGSATWTIDRAVEPDGLTVLRWRLGDGDDAVEVESSLRLTPADRAALTAAVPTNSEVPDAGHPHS